jgi:mannose-1-phosphate guanylyltransferase/mannose-6-phosphate isomerase
MIVVIIAGGSGTRLWPLSTSNFPKHLLSLTNEQSLLQNTYSRVKDLAPADQIFVVSEKSHADHVTKQLPEVPEGNVLVEPGRRGTASCFMLAMRVIKERGLDDQAIFFLWSDHVVRDRVGFTGTATVGAELAEKEQKMVFVGIEPTYPTTGLGYMKKGARLTNGHKNAFELDKFVEKPDHKTAVKYFRSGDYLWNTGYLISTMSTLEREIQQNAPEMWRNYQALLKTDKPDEVYLGFESEAIDTALSEKITDAFVVPGSFDWLDIGAFNDLHEANESDEQGNHLRGKRIYEDEVQNAYIRNEEEKPLVVIGLDNIVVVNTPNGLLVARKDLSQRVKDAVSRMKDSKS